MFRYPARASEVEHRLVEIGNGGDWEREVWEKGGGEEDVCGGFGLEIADLEEIVECILDEALAVV